MDGARSVGLVLLVLATTPAWAQDVGDKSAGRQLAEELCSDCHAVGADDFYIPNAAATHFADTASKPGMTATALHAWLQSSHPTMPNIILTPGQRDDIIAHILSLKGL